jgi:hypothetical protein
VSDPLPTEVCRVIASGRYDLSNEKAVQVGMQALLSDAWGVAVEREVSLSPGDRPDFRIGGVVVEVKVRGARKVAIWKQLKRYAAHDCVTAIVLVTNLSMGLPKDIEGKPAFYVSLGRAWL